MVPRRRYAAMAALLLVGCSAESETRSASTVRVVRTTPPSTSTKILTTTTSAEPTTTEALPVQELPVPLPAPDPDAIELGPRLGNIEIDRLGVNESFFEGIAISTLNRGPGHWPGTALPGMWGNVVLGGHRTSKGRPFRHLEQLVLGDEVIFTTDAGRFVYYVTHTEIVTPDSMWIVNQTEGYSATLFACHPVGSTKERIVVFLALAG